MRFAATNAVLHCHAQGKTAMKPHTSHKPKNAVLHCYAQGKTGAGFHRGNLRPFALDGCRP